MVKKFFLLAILFFSCYPYSKIEWQAARSAGLNQEELSFIKKLTKEPLVAWQGDTSFLNKKMTGLLLKVDFSESPRVLGQLQAFFYTRGKLVFLTEQNYDVPGSKNTIIIFSGKDQFDIVRIQKLSDIQRNITTESIIVKLKEWSKEFSFIISEAESYRMVARFVTRPGDMMKFTEELIELCPELLNDGSGDSEDLMNTMIADNSFRLFF